MLIQLIFRECPGIYDISLVTVRHLRRQQPSGDRGRGGGVIWLSGVRAMERPPPHSLWRLKNTANGDGGRGRQHGTSAVRGRDSRAGYGGGPGGRAVRRAAPAAGIDDQLGKERRGARPG